MLAAFPRPAVGLAAAMAVVGAVLPAAPAVATSAPAGAGGALLRYEIGAVIAGGASGTVSAMAMNEAGEVTGAANRPLDGFRWSETSLDVLPDLPGHIDHIAQDLDDTRTVVGIAGRFGEDNYPRAVRWVDGVPEDLGVLEPTGASEAYGVNDAGMVVGSASVGFGWRSLARSRSSAGPARSTACTGSTTTAPRLAAAWSVSAATSAASSPTMTSGCATSTTS